jgi:hypothetical protein
MLPYIAYMDPMGDVICIAIEKSCIDERNFDVGGRLFGSKRSVWFAVDIYIWLVKYIHIVRIS